MVETNNKKEEAPVKKVDAPKEEVKPVVEAPKKEEVKNEPSESDNLISEVCAKVYMGDVKLTEKVVGNFKAKNGSEQELVTFLKDKLNLVK